MSVKRAVKVEVEYVTSWIETSPGAVVSAVPAEQCENRKNLVEVKPGL